MGLPTEHCEEDNCSFAQRAQKLPGCPWTRGVEEGLCGAWPTAGALKSVLQGWEGGRHMGTGIGGGCSPSRRAWLGGAPAWGPLWEPPQYRGSSSSRFKVELIQRGQPSHLETQKETGAGSGGGGVSQGGAGPAGPFAPGSQTPKGSPAWCWPSSKSPPCWTPTRT